MCAYCGCVRSAIIAVQFAQTLSCGAHQKQRTKWKRLRSLEIRRKIEAIHTRTQTSTHQIQWYKKCDPNRVHTIIIQTIRIRSELKCQWSAVSEQINERMNERTNQHQLNQSTYRNASMFAIHLAMLSYVERCVVLFCFG